MDKLKSNILFKFSLGNDVRVGEKISQGPIQFLSLSKGKPGIFQGDHESRQRWKKTLLTFIPGKAQEINRLFVSSFDPNDFICD
jgi:hypothetical protein